MQEPDTDTKTQKFSTCYWLHVKRKDYDGIQSSARIYLGIPCEIGNLFLFNSISSNFFCSSLSPIINYSHSCEKSKSQSMSQIWNIIQNIQLNNYLIDWLAQPKRKKNFFKRVSVQRDEAKEKKRMSIEFRNVSQKLY